MSIFNVVYDGANDKFISMVVPYLTIFDIRAFNNIIVGNCTLMNTRNLVAGFFSC